VAKRLHRFGDLERVAALASLNVEEQPETPAEIKPAGILRQ